MRLETARPGRWMGSSGRLGESSSPGARGSGAAARRPGRGLMASPFLPLAAWITSGRPLPFPRGRNSRETQPTAAGRLRVSIANAVAHRRRPRTEDGCRSVPEHLFNGEHREQTAGFGHASRTTAQRANLCMGSESANRGATPADDEDVPSFVSEGRARRISPQVPTVALEGAGRHWIDRGSRHRSPCTPASSSSAEMALAPFNHGPGGTSRRPHVRNQPISGFQLAMVEDEHRRLKALAADLTLDKHMWSEALRKTG